MAFFFKFLIHNYTKAVYLLLFYFFILSDFIALTYRFLKSNFTIGVNFTFFLIKDISALLYKLFAIKLNSFLKLF